MECRFESRASPPILKDLKDLNAALSCCFFLWMGFLSYDSWIVQHMHRREGMKRTIALLSIVAVLSIVCAKDTRSQGRVGIGFIVGDPTGFSFKYKFSSMNALDGALGFSPFDRFRMHVDYLWISRPFSNQQFSLTYGAGAAIGFGSSEHIDYRGRYVYFTRDVPMGFGVRVPLGVSYLIPRSPVELTLELAPMVIFAPNGGVGIDGGLAVRFYP